ncbi:hypothetical protein QU487_06380 [Crenobacter sp. SG2305]|uniref:hypothetical protein n=1 Tax=Crenobacter oryzisoli TaxID=3056844 RepID=UPI0025AAB95F|nr:hypothetical protein [Crenobacter sp. SG2305]MDN0082379.1 hypothetical protein [Crenobacter sp. SG2305]
MTSSKILAKRLVEPGVVALQAIREGEISAQQIVNLHMMTRLAVRARARRMVAPKNSQPVEALTRPITGAFTSGERVILDEETIEQAELWVKALRDQLGRSSQANLMGLINDLVLIASIKSAEQAND